MFRKIDYGLGYGNARALFLALLSFPLRLCFHFLSLAIRHHFPPLRFPFPRARVLPSLVVIAQRDVENKPTDGDGARLMDIALCSVMMRSLAGINRMRRRRHRALGALLKRAHFKERIWCAYSSVSRNKL